jgi:uncharacterized protein YfaS (alpha-2-macroglobulin family)
MALTIIRAGKAVQLVWNLSTLNAGLLPALTYNPYSPPNPPVITIFDSTGTKQVSQQAMTLLATGVYSYTYVTPSGGPLGVWTAELDVVDNNGVPSGSVFVEGQAEATPVFQVV